MTFPQIRAMVTGNTDGKIVRAVLQRQRGFTFEHGSPFVVWEDVRDLEVTADGTVILGRYPDQSQEKEQA